MKYKTIKIMIMMMSLFVFTACTPGKAAIVPIDVIPIVDKVETPAETPLEPAIPTIPEPEQGLPMPAETPTENIETPGGSVEEIPEDITVEIPVNEVMYTTSDLNMRSGPGKDYEVIGVLKENAMVTVVDKLENGWAFVRDGYVSLMYLSDEIPENAPEDTVYAPMTIYLHGKAVPYLNGGVDKGQEVIDGNPNYASTWGGMSPWSGDDGVNTHFIAHDYGAFNGIWEMKTEDRIIVTNSNGIPTHYALEEMFLVDRYGINVVDGTALFNFITSTEGGEVLTLQTCKPETEHNWILRAKKVN